MRKTGIWKFYDKDHLTFDNKPKFIGMYEFTPKNKLGVFYCIGDVRKNYCRYVFGDAKFLPMCFHHEYKTVKQFLHTFYKKFKAVKV
jgi:hypothetical protein